MENLSSNRSVSRTVTNFRSVRHDAGGSGRRKNGAEKNDTEKIIYGWIYILDDERVRQFLIVGEDEALLIDTGFEDSHVYQAVREYHGSSGSGSYDSRGQRPRGRPERFWSLQDSQGRLEPDPGRNSAGASEGGRYFPVRRLYAGSDRNSRPYLRQCRVCGLGKEAAAAGRFRPERRADLYVRRTQKSDLYLESQRKLLGIMDRIETVLPCHHDCPITPDYIGKKSSGRRGAEKRTSARRETSVYAVPHLSWNMDGFLLYGETITGSVRCIVAKRKILKGD